MSLFDRHILSIYYLCNKLYYQKHNKITFFLVKVLYRYYNFFLKFLYGAYIPYKAKIGKNVNFIHSFHGIFISQNAVIGDNCTILHHVTIGSNIQKEDNSEAPLIKDNVFIGCNVCIIGRTIIGNNTKIGAGVVIINKTISNFSTVVTEKFKILKENK